MDSAHDTGTGGLNEVPGETGAVAAHPKNHTTVTWPVALALTAARFAGASQLHEARESPPRRM
jgi:hypothetical protein